MAISTVQERSPTQAALERATEHLLSLQDPVGFWKGELETNVTMDAEDLLLREFLGIRGAAETERAARWIRSQQRADGTWAKFAGGPGDISTTIEAYVALRLAGDAPDVPHMARAAAWVRAEGGLARARVFTHLWLALFGCWRWDDVPMVPPELVFVPPWLPFSVYDFSCWTRQTLVATALVMAHRPCRPLPFAIDELEGSEPWRRPRARNGRQRALLAVDRLLHRYARRPFAPLRRLAIARAEHWIVCRQEGDGSWGGIQPPWVYSIIALHLGGMPLEHPVLARALAGLQTFLIDDERGRRLEACQSPVWDTALAAIALDDAVLAGAAAGSRGVDAAHAAVARAARWLLGEEVRVRGDWAVGRPGVEPGGWAFEFHNDNYPDVDDTAEVVLALQRALALLDGRAGERAGAAIARARTWVEAMQSAGGGWAAFDADNTREIVREIPFLDFGEAIDDPSADVTAHALEMLAALGAAGEGPARRGRDWLLAAQEADGSWYGRWGVNYVYGTGAAVPALVACGLRPGHPAIRRAVRWLESHQNDDGGWGEDCRSYDDAAWRGRGASTPSQTAWALLALHAAGERSPALARGVQFLLASQRDDGGWDESFHTGTGFPGDFYINYHLYRIAFPIMALARCVSAGIG